MTHPCEKHCPNYEGEQCATCMIPEVEGEIIGNLIDELVEQIWEGD